MNKLIEEAILEAELKKVKVVSLELLNQVRSYIIVYLASLSNQQFNQINYG